MSILITGGSGFIGAEIAQMLSARGDGPIHVSNRSGNFERLGPLADTVELIQADLGDVDAVARMVRDVKPDRLFHFGAMLTGPGEADPQALLQSNAIGVIRLFEEARLAGTEQIIFASSIGTYGRDLAPGLITDRSLQRPNTIYGVTKVFGENLGAYYRTKYGLDYRGIRYPSVVGPGVTTRSIVQYTSWMIEHAAQGKPFVVWTPPETIVPILYYKDAARAALDLAAAPSESIEAINYLVDGVPPTPTAGELADAVRERIPEAQISFEPNPTVAAALSRSLAIDDAAARQEWGWQPEFGVGDMIDDFVLGLTR
ncbi:MAG: NAD-dependent epimerase/dehydratase family protein [Acidimicrobiales bacterium]